MRFSPFFAVSLTLSLIATEKRRLTCGGDRNCYFAVDRAHTGLMDLFVTHFRKELEKAPKKKKPSVLDKLSKSLPEAAAKPGKCKAQEL